MKVGLYAGSFDPFTYGHYDIVLQALCVFDKVVIAIGENQDKQRNIELVESMNVIASYFRDDYIPRKVEVNSFIGSLSGYAEQTHPTSIVRGMRQVSDFNDEFTLNAILTNEGTAPLTYFICHPDFLHVSS